MQKPKLKNTSQSANLEQIQNELVFDSKKLQNEFMMS